MDPRILATRLRALPAGVWAGLAACVYLVVEHQLSVPTWKPSGSDWDLWYMSALAQVREGLVYPAARWPLYGMVADVVGLLPGPLHRDATLVSLVATGGAVGALVHLTRPVLGLAPAVVAAMLALTHPFVHEHAGWIGPYALSGGLACLTVAALREAVAGSKVAWVCTGLFLGADFAVLEKGLIVGGALGALTLAAWLRVSRSGWDLLRMAAPFSALAGLYAAFPHPLVSLDGMAKLPFGQIGPGILPESATSEGYVFGQRMGPGTLWGTWQTLQGLSSRNGWSLGWSRFIEAQPGVGLESAEWLGLGMGVVLCLAAWRLRAKPGSPELADGVGLLGVAALVASCAPAFRTNLEMRFLESGLLAAPFLLVAPFGLLPRRFGFLALALLPLCVWTGSPWTGSPWLSRSRRSTSDDSRDFLAAQVWAGMQAKHAGMLVDVYSPRAGGILVLEDSAGLPMEAGELATPDPTHALLVATPDGRGAAPLGQDATVLPLNDPKPDLSGRTVLDAWTAGHGSRAAVYLVSAVGS